MRGHYATALLALAVFVLVVPLRSGYAAYRSAEVTSYHAGYELSTGQYSDHEVRPLAGAPKPPWELAPGGDRSMRSDAHAGVPGYERRSCVSCHAGAARTLHAVRGEVTCAMCHGRGAMASVNHYFSKLNPIRRHAYVCAKCHDGASVSFASYVVHEPNPVLPETRQVFPAFWWAFWIMLGVATVTFVLLIPHTVLWLVREAASRLRKEGGHEN